MANLNKVMLIGWLMRDPEIRVIASGGKVAAFGFAVNNRKKNPATGLWEEEPVFLDVEAWNRETGRKTADLVEQYLRKGNQAYIEGHLKLDQWTDKNDGSKRSKLRIVVDDVQFLDPKGDGSRSMSGGASRPVGAAQVMDGPPMGEESFESAPASPALEPAPATRPEEDIPF